MLQYNNKIFLKRMLAFLWLVFMITKACAGIPLWTFEPLTPTTIAVPVNGSALVQYRITNQSSRPFTLNMRPIRGTTQITTGLNACGNSFVLSGKNSCILYLLINGSQLNEPVMDGPFVCQQENLNQCYRPSSSNILRLTRGPPEGEATISITNPSQSSRVVTVSETTPLSLEVTNNLDSPANANAITVSDNASCPNLSVDDSNCAIVAPGASCTLKLTSSTPYAPCTITVTGRNTTNSPTTLIAFSYLGGLVYQESSGNGKIIINAEQGFRSSWTVNDISDIPTSLEDGLANTNAIVADENCSNDTDNCAAQRCRNISVDWFLPARNELSAVYSALCSGTSGCLFGDFNSRLMSSSQQDIDSRNIWLVNVNVNTYRLSRKNRINSVRCVRDFTL